MVKGGFEGGADGGYYHIENAVNGNTVVDINGNVKVDTAGLGKSLGVEMVIYQEIDGEVKYHSKFPLNVVAEDGNVLTYHLTTRMKNAGVFRYAFRVYPWNDQLPHRQDFAYMKWI